MLSNKKLMVVLWLHPLIVSRPGGSVSHHSNLTPGQWGSGFMTSGSVTPQGSPASGLSSQQTGDTDDFGDFSQGPSFPGQGGNDRVFGVFQEAAGQQMGQFGGVLLTVRLTYLGPLLPVEHRPSTTFRQRTLFWAVLAVRSVIKFNDRLHSNYV